MEDKLKFDETDCLVSAVGNWAKEHKDRCAIVIVEDEESNIRTCCVGSGKELITTMASTLDGGNEDIEEIILTAQKLLIAKGPFKDM